MLTQDQIDKLQPLMEHSKFGDILKDAVEVWKRDDVTPAWGDYGFYNDYKNRKYVLDEMNQCCLIGASLIDKSFHDSPCTSLFEYFNITINEFEGLYEGFDNIPKYIDSNEEAWNFGFSVRMIVNPIEIEE